MRRKGEERAGQRLAVLAGFAGVLLNFPLLSALPAVHDAPAAAWLYLFVVWAGVIGLAAWSGRKDRR